MGSDGGIFYLEKVLTPEEEKCLNPWIYCYGNFSSWAAKHVDDSDIEEAAGAIAYYGTDCDDHDLYDILEFAQCIRDWNVTWGELFLDIETTPSNQYWRPAYRLGKILRKVYGPDLLEPEDPPPLDMRLVDWANIIIGAFAKIATMETWT